jgi:hypothetical protein
MTLRIALHWVKTELLDAPIVDSENNHGFPVVGFADYCVVWFSQMLPSMRGFSMGETDE